MGGVRAFIAATLTAACLATVGPAAHSWAAAARTGAAPAETAPLGPGEARLSRTGQIILPRPRAAAPGAASSIGATASTPGSMSGAAAVSSDDVWAVGSAQSGGTYVPFAEHWNGSTWTPASVPAPPNVTTSYFNAVAAVSADDVWAVGAETSSSGPQLTLIEHWDGTAWSIVPSPNLGTDLNMLNGVTAVSADDVWAVGNAFVNGIIETQVLRWNGNSWAVVPSPNVTGVNANQLNQVTVVSKDNIWAVGYFAVLDVQYSTLAEHWNGTKWSIVHTPPIATSNYDLQGVSAVSAHDVLAVGYEFDPKTELSRTLTERWNGTAWQRVPSSSPQLSSFLFVTTALSATDAWADGWFALSSGEELPFTEHWNGTKWSFVTVPVPQATYSNLIGIAGISASDVWTAGSYQLSGGDSYPLYEHWNGQSWTMTTP